MIPIDTIDIAKEFASKRSDLDFDSNMLKGNLGLGNSVIEKVIDDIIVVNATDVVNGTRVIDGFAFCEDTDVKHWRQGVVMIAGPAVKQVAVGDIVVFPGVKGMETGELSVRQPDGSIAFIENGHFLTESRIFGVVTPLARN